MFASTSWRINYAKLISSTVKQMKIHLPNPTVIALLMVHLVGCMIPQTGHNKPPKMFPNWSSFYFPRTFSRNRGRGHGSAIPRPRWIFLPVPPPWQGCCCYYTWHRMIQDDHVIKAKSIKVDIGVMSHLTFMIITDNLNNSAAELKLFSWRLARSIV